MSRENTKKMVEFGRGVIDALPILIAYFPAAFAMGAAAVSLGMQPGESALWSLIMFSGANQALFLSTLESHTPLVIFVALASLLTTRHLLYGLALRKYIHTSFALKMWFAYGLTDEVFAIASAATAKTARQAHGFWFVGLGMTALGSWVLGTYAGAVLGAAMAGKSTALQQALDFALPALFIALVWSAFRKSLLGNLLLAALFSAAMILLGLPALAIPAGACAALISFKRSND